MDQIVHTVLCFDRFVLDLTRGCLHDGSRKVELRPKAFQVLTYLALNAGRLVPKKELLDAAWPGVVVSDESLVQCIRELRQKMGEGAHRLIKTVPRRGYVLETTITSGHASGAVLCKCADLVRVAEPARRGEVRLAAGPSEPLPAWEAAYVAARQHSGWWHPGPGPYGVLLDASAAA